MVELVQWPLWQLPLPSSQSALAAASAASFYAHVYFDKAYHVQGSKLERFAWFRHKQQLHFVPYLHASSNFVVIAVFWDRLLGTSESLTAMQGAKMNAHNRAGSA